MKSLKRTLFAAGVLALSGVALYKLLLSDEARQSLRDGFGAVREACEKVCDTVNESYGVVMTDDASNRENTRRQWESLGY